MMNAGRKEYDFGGQLAKALAQQIYSLSTIELKRGIR